MNQIAVSSDGLLVAIAVNHNVEICDAATGRMILGMNGPGLHVALVVLLSVFRARNPPARDGAKTVTEINWVRNYSVISVP